MIIRKKTYEKLMCEWYEYKADNAKLKAELGKIKTENFNLRNMDKISEDRIAGYVQKCDELNVEIANLKSSLSIMQDRYKTSEEIRNKLIDQNQRLITMVEKFLKKEEERHG